MVKQPSQCMLQEIKSVTAAMGLAISSMFRQHVGFNGPQWDSTRNEMKYSIRTLLTALRES